MLTNQLRSWNGFRKIIQMGRHEFFFWFFFFWCCLFPGRLLSRKIIAKRYFSVLKKFHFKKDLERVFFLLKQLFWLRAKSQHNESLWLKNPCYNYGDIADIAASLVIQTVKNLCAMQKTQIRFLGQEDPLEKGMVTHSSILAWKIPWTKEPGGYSPWGGKESDTTEWLSLTHHHTGH